MKKRQRNIPTILGLVLLLGSLLVGVFFIGLKTSYEADFSAGEIPEEVRLTNVDDRSFTVSWVTKNQSSGFVSYGESPAFGKTKGEAEQSSFVHHVRIDGLLPSERYFFQIVSGGENYDDFGKPYVAQTGPLLGVSGLTNVVYGHIDLPSTPDSLSRGALVYLTTVGSQTLSTVADPRGNWVMSVSALRVDNLSSYFLLSSNTSVDVVVRASVSETATAKIPLVAARPVPNMTLGESYDFSNLLLVKSVEAPVASLQIPQLLGASSEVKEIAPTPTPVETTKKVDASSFGVNKLFLLTPYIAGFIIGLGLFVSGFLVEGNFFHRIRFFRKH